MSITFAQAANRLDRIIRKSDHFLKEEADELRRKILEYQIKNMYDDPTGPYWREDAKAYMEGIHDIRIVSSTLAYSLGVDKDADLFAQLIIEPRNFERRPEYKTSRLTKKPISLFSANTTRVQLTLGTKLDYAVYHEYEGKYAFFYPGVAQGRKWLKKQTDWMDIRPFIIKGMNGLL